MNNVKTYNPRRETPQRCARCSKDFYPLLYSKNQQLFCSRKCATIALAGERPQRLCLQCGKDITHSRSRKQKYCSHLCYAKSLKGKPSKRDRRQTRLCSWCGKPITRSPSEFTGIKAFCNFRCEAEWQSEFENGENSHHWKGGSPNYYGASWMNARRNALIKANGICQRCHKRKATDVHHLLPIRLFNSRDKANFESNLKAVCTRCHKIEHLRLKKSLPLLELLYLQTAKNKPMAQPPDIDGLSSWVNPDGTPFAVPRK